MPILIASLSNKARTSLSPHKKVTFQDLTPDLQFQQLNNVPSNAMASRVESKSTSVADLLPLVKPDMQISRIRLSHCLHIMTIREARYNGTRPSFPCRCWYHVSPFRGRYADPGGDAPLHTTV